MAMTRRDITSFKNGARVDNEGVKRFANAMRRKLAKKRKDGYGGWHSPGECAENELVDMMADHVKKGDMVDIANFAMMIWNRRNPK